ncbi:MAG: hypothetical protein WEB28_05280 [Nitrosopumilaceae archaeon]
MASCHYAWKGFDKQKWKSQLKMEFTTQQLRWQKKLLLLDLSKEEFVKKVVSITTPRPMNYGMVIKVIKVNKGIIPLNPMMIPDLEMGPNRCSVQ